MTNLEQTHLVEEIKRKFSGEILQEKDALSGKGRQAASVLVPLAFHNDKLVVLYTHRSNQLSRHRGQVSFPGGMEEEGDNNLMNTALRETHEEIGILPEQVEIFGSLQPLVSPISDYFIYPFVGFIKDLNGISRNIDEVEKIFCIPLKWLLTPENLAQEDYLSSSGDIHKVWIFRDFEGEKVWGITAEITRRLIEKIR